MKGCYYHLLSFLQKTGFLNVTLGTLGSGFSWRFLSCATASGAAICCLLVMSSALSICDCLFPFKKYLFFLFLTTWMWMSACLCVHMCLWAEVSQEVKRVQSSLRLTLQVVVSYLLRVQGTELGPSVRAEVSPINCWAVSPAATPLI